MPYCEYLRWLNLGFDYVGYECESESAKRAYHEVHLKSDTYTLNPRIQLTILKLSSEVEVDQ